MNTTTTNTKNDTASCGCGPSCCGGETVRNAAAAAAATGASRAAQTPVDEAAADAVREKVRVGYGQIARSGGWNAAGETQAASGCCSTSAATAGPAATSAKASSGCCGGPSAAASASGTKAGGGCCGPATFSPEQLAAAIGYSQSDLAATPESANMGLSCGNPTAIAALKPGEVVIDLGSGGGFDCFVAGPKVGATGRVIGIDMTPDMLSKARRNIASYTEQSGLGNVEFRLGEIENIPVADATADVVISNCVLNLSPDKPRVWKEIARVLKPGGRVAVSDLALLRPLPESVRADVEALIGCIAGAVMVEETRAQMLAAGLTDIVLTSKPSYIDAMTDWQDPLYRKIIEALPAGAKPGDYITSLDIAARRPERD
jgi:SAM-dependent methyltransferase